MRINKFLSTLGIASRRAVDKYIEEGRITVNGNIATTGMDISENDNIFIDGKKIKTDVNEEKVYFMLNKPLEVLSASSDDRGRKTVVDLVKTDKMIYRFGSGNKTENDLLLIINKLTKLAINTGKDLVIEDLNFLKIKSKATKGKSKKDKKYNKMLHSLAYRIFLNRTEQICNKKNVGLIKVNPAWTSWIAKNKFCDKMKLNIHTGASFVIARRGMNIKDVV